MLTNLTVQLCIYLQSYILLWIYLYIAYENNSYAERKSFSCFYVGKKLCKTAVIFTMLPLVFYIATGQFQGKQFRLNIYGKHNMFIIDKWNFPITL